MKTDIILLGTEGCHLCELAYRVIHQAGLSGRTRIEDIVERSEWLERYQDKIPVIILGERDLCWPFNVEELQDWPNRAA